MPSYSRVISGRDQSQFEVFQRCPFLEKTVHFWVTIAIPVEPDSSPRTCGKHYVVVILLNSSSVVWKEARTVSPGPYSAEFWVMDSFRRCVSESCREMLKKSIVQFLAYSASVALGISYAEALTIALKIKWTFVCSQASECNVNDTHFTPSNKCHVPCAG